MVRSTGPLPQRLCTRGWWTGYDVYVADQHASLLEWPSFQVSESWPPTLSRYIFHCQIQRLYSGYLVTRGISVLMCVWILSLMRTVSLHVFISDQLDVWLYQTNSRWQRTIKKKMQCYKWKQHTNNNNDNNGCRMNRYIWLVWCLSHARCCSQPNHKSARRTRTQYRHGQNLWILECWIQRFH